MWSIIALGSVVFLVSGLRVDISQIDIRCLFLALITIGIGSRISIKIPRVKGHISVSDTFIFLSILLFGGEVAVLLSAAEALCSSMRFSKLRLVIAFNGATAACSTFITVWALRLIFGFSLPLA